MYLYVHIFSFLTMLGMVWCTLLAGVGVVGIRADHSGADTNDNAKSIHDSAVDFRFISYIPHFSFLR